MKYALINFKGERLKDDIEWDGKLTMGLYAKIEEEYLVAAELWPMDIADEVERLISVSQALVKQATDNHSKLVYSLRNKLVRGELK